MEALLSNASGSIESIENSHGDLHYGLPTAFSTSSLRSEIPERLLQDDASILCQSYSDQNTSATHDLLQENACSPREQPLQQNDPGQQEELAFPRHEDTQDHPDNVSESSTTLFQEQNHAETDEDVRKPSRKPYSWKEKLGTFAIVGLIVGSVLLCASVGTLAFMWFGSPAIPAWKEITSRNWLSKVISICIGVIQQVMMLQLGIVTATLASLALESRDVMIGDVASVSAMRATATSTGAFVMAWQYLSGSSYRSAHHTRNIFLMLSAALLWCLGQFLLLIILTDVSLRSTAGLASLASLPYSLYYNETDPAEDFGGSVSQFQDPSVGPWNRKASQYASFAEYSEPPYDADGVSDTGVTLRAFLPFGTAQDRERLESYKGNVTVLDARVTCQVPQIKNATIDSNVTFRGSLAATRNTPRLANLSLDYGNTVKSPVGMGADFDCTLAFDFDSETEIPQWSLSLCQLWRGYDEANSDRAERFNGLYSEFQDLSLIGHTEFNGSAYLFLNTTPGTMDDFFYLMNRTEFAVQVAEASQARGEWLDLTYFNGSIIISASICYAAFDFANVDVTISSQFNRTESRLEPVFDGATSTYTFQGLRSALGQDQSLPTDQRGILELARETWQVAPDKKNLESRRAAWHLRKTADLAFTASAFIDSPIGAPCVTGHLLRSTYCPSMQSHACMYPEEMHVSNLLDDMTLPHQVVVALVGLRSFDETQIMRCGMVCPGITCTAILYSHKIDSLFLRTLTLNAIEIARARDPQDKRFHCLRSPNHDYPAQ